MRFVRTRSRTLIWLGLGIVCLCSSADSYAAPSRFGNQLPDDRFYAQSEHLLQQLNRPVAFRWQDVPLGKALSGLSLSSKVPLWLDRRVDPHQSLTLSVRQQSLREALDEITAAVGLGYAVSGELVYVGTKQNAAELRTLLALADQQADSIKPALRRKMLQRNPLSIERLTEPSLLLERLIGDAGVRAEGLKQVPHDLWPDRQLPAMPMAHQLTLLLHEFDLVWEATQGGKQITIVPLERPVTIRRLHPEEALSALPSGTVAAERIQPTRTPGVVSVEAIVEIHERIANRRSPPAAKRQRSAKTEQDTHQVFTLRVRQQPVGAILKHVAQQTGHQLELDELSEVERNLLTERVSFEVANATLDELLQAICKPAGLRANSQSGTITVEPLEVAAE